MRYLRNVPSTVPGIRKVFDKQELLLINTAVWDSEFGFLKRAVLGRFFRPTVLLRRQLNSCLHTNLNPLILTMPSP